MTATPITEPGTDIPHAAHRGSDVEVWIRAARDQQPPGSNAWYALDFLLDDTGTPLGETVAGPHPEEY